MSQITKTADILAALSHYQPLELAVTAETAAVMIVLLKQVDSVEIILTERSATLPTFSGDYSFPGGMRDPEDSNLYATAQRELYEELNIAPDAYHYVGQLNDFHDKYQRLVRPFVVQMDKNEFVRLHKISADEIEQIYYFPLSNLSLILDNPVLQQITKRRPSYSFTEDNVFVWGLTAAILVHLSSIIQKSNL